MLHVDGFSVIFEGSEGSTTHSAGSFWQNAVQARVGRVLLVMGRDGLLRTLESWACVFADTFNGKKVIVRARRGQPRATFVQAPSCRLFFRMAPTRFFERHFREACTAQGSAQQLGGCDAMFVGRRWFRG